MRMELPLLAVAPLVFVASGAGAVGQAGAAESIASRQIMALTYPEDEAISVKFEGTSRLPRSSGEAKVERKKGMTEIEIELDEMKPASLFGGDYNTYVLWVASPEGHLDNTGEFILEGNRSKLNVSTPLETFGMFITAEPHFLVSAPSRFVVMENTRPADDGHEIRVSTIEYRGFEGVYNFENESLKELPESKGELRAHLGAAQTAISLAERAGAERFAEGQLQGARRALQNALVAARAGTEGKEMMLLAHDVIRRAVAAQRIAAKRSYETALAEERRANEKQIGRLQSAVAAASGDAERARLEARQKRLEAQMEVRAREKPGRTPKTRPGELPKRRSVRKKR